MSIRQEGVGWPGSRNQKPCMSTSGTLRPRPLPQCLPYVGIMGCQLGKTWQALPTVARLVCMQSGCVEVPLDTLTSLPALSGPVAYVPSQQTVFLMS